jgi:hypothetical protein
VTLGGAARNAWRAWQERSPDLVRQAKGQRPSEDTRGLIYFAKAEGLDRIKIGFTRGSLEARAKGLQTGCPARVVMVACMRGTLADEMRLHARFDAYRIHDTEWFHDHDELRSVIAEHVLG